MGLELNLNNGRAVQARACGSGPDCCGAAVFRFMQQVPNSAQLCLMSAKTELPPPPLPRPCANPPPFARATPISEQRRCCSRNFWHMEYGSPFFWGSMKVFGDLWFGDGILGML